MVYIPFKLCRLSKVRVAAGAFERSCRRPSAQNSPTKLALLPLNDPGSVVEAMVNLWVPSQHAHCEEADTLLLEEQMWSEDGDNMTVNRSVFTHVDSTRTYHNLPALGRYIVL
jgi:hypothetical protein